MDHPALELLQASGMDAREFGALLAICARNQGSSVPSVLKSLQASAEHDSALARNVLSAYQQADAALQAVTDEATTARLHSGPGQSLRATRP